MENKRVLLAIGLSALVVYIYSSFFMPTPQTVDHQKTITGTSSLSVDAEGNKEGITDEKSALTGDVSLKRTSTNKSTVIRAEESTVDGAKYRAVFSSRGGGGLVTFELKDYKKDTGKESSLVNRVNIEKGDPLPLSLSFKGNGVNLLEDVVFYTKEKGGDKLVYEWSTDEGVTFEKSYYFKPDDYRIDLQVRIINKSLETVHGSLGISLFERYDDASRGKYDIRRLLVRTDKDLEKVDFDDLKDKKDVKEGNIRWMAIESKYFITALLPEEAVAGAITSRTESGSLIASTLEDKNVEVAVGSDKIIKYTVYSGPKDLNILKNTGKGLEEAIDFGFFHAIAEPLLRFLKFMYSYLGNYGYAIIFVTLIIKILFFPLANKSYKSMNDMKKLQPQMADLKEKYKDNKERMSKEVMALYKKNRVNPLSGCLPMVLQIPVFIALYNVLLNSIELRHTPFHFWITDLSSKDPYYITPIVMGATMFLQQKMSPSAPDATQQKVMMMMPVVFTFMFMNLPSGLVLYWVVNNILSIAQQYYIMKKA